MPVSNWQQYLISKRNRVFREVWENDDYNSSRILPRKLNTKRDFYVTSLCHNKQFSDCEICNMMAELDMLIFNC